MALSSGPQASSALAGRRGRGRGGHLLGGDLPGPGPLPGRPRSRPHRRPRRSRAAAAASRVAASRASVRGMRRRGSAWAIVGSPPVAGSDVLAEADGNRTRQAEMLGFTGFEDRGGHQEPGHLRGHRTQPPRAAGLQGRSGRRADGAADAVAVRGMTVQRDDDGTG